jgi:hypothetical protein
MATIAQIEANRRNSQKSTGPTSDTGKEAVRFNALKSGIDAASIIIPGEDPDQFSKLAEEFTDNWQPVNASERELVDHLIEDSWRIRRLRAAEAQIWTVSIEYRRTSRSYKPGKELGEAYGGNAECLARLYRQIAGIKRTNHQTTLDLQRLQSARKAAEAAALAQAAAELEAAQPVPPEPLPQCPRPQSLMTEQSQFPLDPTALVPPQPKHDAAYWRKFVAENCAPSAKVPL